MTHQGDWWPATGADEFAVPRIVDVLVPTRNRPNELATCLAGLAGQLGAGGFGIAVSDQSDGPPGWAHPAVATMVRTLAYRGHPVHLRQHLPRRGMAEQRAFLLSLSRARYVLNLDDDVWLEPHALRRLVTALRWLSCGFVGNAPHGLSFLDDERPRQQVYEEWPGRPSPEHVRRGDPAWRRASLHAAANLAHLTARLDLAPDEWRAYKVAWLGACVLYDRGKLLDCGGFGFWPRTGPGHTGEEVVTQLTLLERYGGAGIVPSGAYHLESDTTLPGRQHECYDEVIEDRSGVRASSVR